MEDLIAVLERVRWFSFASVMSEGGETFGKDADPGLSRVTFGILVAAERTRCPLYAEPLLRMPHRMDKAARDPAGGGNSPESLRYRRRVGDGLKACTGAEKVEQAAEFESWRKANRKSRSKPGLRVLVPRGRKAVDAQGGRASCPHHENRKHAQKEKAIEAFRAFP